MELRQLRYYVAIADHGSLSSASRILHIAQSALTQQVQQLEDELGVQLLHRSSQGVLATETGKTFYEYAQAILKQVSDAKFAIAQSNHNLVGSVALGMPQSASGVLALPLLKGIREQYPDIALQMTEELTGNLIEQLKSGRLNLAILFDDGQLSAFHTRPLVEETMMFITRAGSAFAPVKGKITLKEAISLPMILPGLHHGVRPRIEKIVRENGLEIANLIEINSIAILKSALLADLGATILPAAPFLSDIDRGGLCAYPISGGPIFRTIVLCASKNIPLSNAALAVQSLTMDISAKLCRDKCWPGAEVIRR